MRLIDADAMMKRLEEWNTNDRMDKALYNFTFNRILEQPTIEPERKRGKWVQKSKPLALCTEWWYECSECGSKPPNDKYGHANHLAAYCQNCYAKMEEPEDIPMEYFESGGR